MKASLSLLSLLPVAVLAFPTGDQVIFGNTAESHDRWSTFENSALDFLDDAKRAILRGKKNMDKWYHDGKEFIKQNELLCRPGPAQYVYVYLP